MSEQIAAQGLDSLVLSDIAHVEMGQSPDSRYVVEDPSAGLPFLQGNAEFGAVNPEPKFGCLRPVKTCKANDVLISVRAPVGAVNLADRDYCIGRGLAAIRGRGIKPSLLGEVVARQSSALRRVAQGTTFEAISKNDLLTLKLSLPPRTDWPKIAQVLDTLDTAIHETEAIIAKLKAVKQGLLHDLLTRGIDANGELRPPQAEAPHLYKQSPLGWIPKEWDAVPLRKLVLDTYRYPSYYGISYVETGVPEVRGECVQPDGTLSHANSGYRYVSEKTASRFPRVRLNPGDLVMTVRGTIGKFALVPEWLKGAVITANLLKLSPDQNVVAPSWLMHVLLSSAFQDRLDAACSATTIKTIQVPALLDIGIATPLKTEQQEIGARLSAIDERLSVELMNLENLNLNKRGLMNDLLTGRVRVTPLLQEAQHA